MGDYCSNCTFMELKCRSDSCRTITIVLIVPLWNWNIFYVVYEGDAESSNCTFMELKLKSSQASLEKSAQF